MERKYVRLVTWGEKVSSHDVGDPLRAVVALKPVVDERGRRVGERCSRARAGVLWMEVFDVKSRLVELRSRRAVSTAAQPQDRAGSIQCGRDRRLPWTCRGLGLIRFR